MDKVEAQLFLQDMFTTLFDPTSNIGRAGEFITEDYTQLVDGVELNRDAFVEHVSLLRTTFSQVRFEFPDIFAGQDDLAERHLIYATKADGSRMTAEVIALHSLRNGRVKRIVEQTRLVDGDPSDHDLGSRVRD